MKQKYPSKGDTFRDDSGHTFEIDATWTHKVHGRTPTRIRVSRTEAVYDVNDLEFKDGAWVVKKRTVVCSVCHLPTSADEAHLHQGEWIGDECWDDRLKVTE